MTAFLRDLRYAARQLRKTPIFTMTAILVLALGIGANTAMFTIINAVLFQRLPYADVGRLVAIDQLNQKGNVEFGAIYPDIAVWQQKARSFVGIAYFTGPIQFIQGPHGADRISVTQGSANLFSVLGVQPALGRMFTAQEQQPDHEKVIVLDEALWSELFHRDPHALGQTVRLDDVPYTVIGVMPPDLNVQAGKHVWVPLALTPAVKTRKSNGGVDYFATIARLRPGVRMATAQAELNSLQQAIVKADPNPMAWNDRRVGVRLTHYRDSLTGQSRQALLTLQGAVFLLWLIACANVANLMLMRSSARQREMAVRSALGASRWRLARYALMESFLLSFAGAAMGLALALAALHVLHHALLQQFNKIQSFHPDNRVLLALLGFSALTALIFGITPAFLSARTSVTQTLQQGGIQLTVGRNQQRLRHTLIVGEIALSLTLLVACGLLLRTLYALRHVPLNFRVENVLTADLAIPAYRQRTDANLIQHLYLPLLERARNLPGIEAASLASAIPLGKGMEAMGVLDRRIYGQHAKMERFTPWLMIASYRAEKVFGYRIVQGRFFNAQDTINSQPVVLVNKAFADEWSPGKSILGKAVFPFRKGSAIVVGVVDDVQQYSLMEHGTPQLYFCLEQLRPTDGIYDLAGVAMELSLRTRLKPEAIVPELRRTLIQAAPEFRSAKIETMQQVVDDSMGSQLLAAHLLELFAGIALLIATAGLYGLLAYMVSLRRREMAIRLAVGAQPRDVLLIVLRHACGLLVCGIAAGVALAYASSRFLRSYLYGVRAHDGWTTVAVCVLFSLCGLWAAYLPARRAANTDPIEALRQE